MRKRSSGLLFDTAGRNGFGCECSRKAVQRNPAGTNQGSKERNMFLKRRMYNIKGAMRAKRITQKKLAQKLGFSFAYISRLINGTRYNRVFEQYIASELNIDYRRFH